MPGNSSRKTDTVKAFLIIKPTSKKKKVCLFICLSSTDVHKAGTMQQGFSETQF